MESPHPHQDRPAPWIDRVPWWATLLLGVVAIAVGVLLATRPLTSLHALGLYLGAALLVLGVAPLFGDRPERTTWDTLRAVGSVVMGLLVLLWLRHHFELLALAVGAALVIAGCRRLWSAAFGSGLSRSDRAASGLLGAAEIVIGVLAVRWPDLTLLAVALVFAVRLVAFGIGRIRHGIDQLRHRSVPAKDRRAPSWVRLVGGTLAVVLALGAAWLGIAAHRGAPVVDDFYATPSTTPTQPGVLLRSEPFTRDVPEGATGWRILYTTTTAGGAPATASAIVLLPEAPGEPAPVITWAHGTTGFATQCAPSVLEHPFEAGATPALEHVVDNGWALVATDYTGLGTPGPHPYMIGAGEGHSVLDARRAAAQLEGADLAPDTVVWGHSQGGHAALWTGQLAPDYAPELEILGVVAMAPAANVEDFASTLFEVTEGPLFASYVIAAYAAHYPDITIDNEVIAPARTLVREMSSRCLGEPSAIASLISVLSLANDRSIYARPPSEGALGRRLAENVPRGPFTVPTLVAQGEADTLIQADLQRAYVDGLCASGEDLEYRSYPGRDHLSLVADDSELIADLLGWTSDRFAGAPPGEGCG